MSEEKKHTHFTAADIDRYHKGQLSAKEMHELEKAALDDPFLADALEGYAVSGVNSGADITELKNRLSERTNRTTIIPINRSSFPWLRVAAIIVVIAGAGLIAYQLAFNNRSKNIAQADSKKAEEIKTTDSIHAAAPSTDEKENVTTTTPVQQRRNNAAEGKNESVTITNQSIGAGSVTSDTAIAGNSNLARSPGAGATAPAKILSEKRTQGSVNNDQLEKKDIAKEEADDKKAVVSNNDIVDKTNKPKIASEAPSGDNDSRSNGLVTMNRQADNQYRNSNVFRGRITDAGNNPVPFANITSTQDNVGTYADAKGYFNLVSPDSVLNVQVRSIGFENNISQLRNNVNNNQVIMQDDRRSLSEVVVISNKKPNAAARSRNSKMKSEEPEPADGWDNYDTYLANNLNEPDEIKTKQTSGNVDVSFEVDKKGNPINIKVEKSLCDKCDQEAIRLIKEGPKWKRKVKKGRATVTIAF